MRDQGPIGPCVANEQLVAMLNEGLDVEARTDIESHVEACVTCQEVLDRLSDLDLAGGEPSGPALIAGEAAPLDRFLRLAKRGGHPPLRPYLRRGDAVEGAPRLEPLGDPAADLPRIAGFQLLRELGRGGMGIVYEAIELALGRRVALKVVLRSPAGSPALVERFRREARAAARLHHTNIVPVFGFGEDAGYLYYTMQLIEGEGLGRAVDRSCGDLTAAAPLPIPIPPGIGGHASGADRFRATARVGLQVALALHYAHQRGVVHRDIKPSNLLLEPGGTAWVADFGLAKTLDDGDDLTQTGDILGTLRYMPPERFDGRSDAVGDLYSLGATLYEIGLSCPLHRAADRVRLIDSILHDEPPRPRSIDPQIPIDLETVLLKLVAKEPSARYLSAAALAEDLRRFLAGEPILARRIGRLEGSWRWSRRNPAIAGLTAGVVLAVVVGFGLTLWGWRRAASHAEQAVAARREVRRVNADLMLDRGLDLLDRGQTTAGRHWLAASLDAAEMSPASRHVALQNLRMWDAASPRLVRMIDEVGWGNYLLHNRDASWLMVFENGSAVARQFKIADGAEGPRLPIDPDRPQLGDERLVVAADQGSAWLNTPAGFFGFLPRNGTDPSGRAEPRWDPIRRSRDGREIRPAADRSAVAVASNGTLRVFDAATGRPLGPPIPITASTRPAFAVAPGGQRLTIIGTEGGRIWDVASGRLIAEAHDIGPTVEHLEADRFGNLIGIQREAGPQGGAVSDGWSVHCWDTQGKPRGETYHEAGTFPEWDRIEFSPDGQTLGLVNRLGQPRLFDSRLGLARGGLYSDPGQVQHLRFSPDGAWLATGTEDGRVQLWDVRTGCALGPWLEHRGKVYGIDFSGDGLSLSIALESHQVAIWRLPIDLLPSRDRPPVVPIGGRSGDAAFSPGADRALIFGPSLDHVQVLATTNERRLAPPRPTWWPHLALLAGASDGRRWAIATSDPHSTACGVDLLDGEGQPIRHLAEAYNWQFALAFTPDGRTLATGGNGGRVMRYDAETGRPVGLPLGVSRVVRSLAFAPDNQTLAIGTGPSNPIGLSCQLQLWDLAAGKIRRALDIREQVAALHYSPDGHSLLIRLGDAIQQASYCRYQIHDAATLQPRGEPLDGLISAPDSVAFLPNGRLLTGGPGGIWEWDVASGKPSRLVIPLTEVLREVSVNRTADLIAVLTQDGRAWLYDPATYRRLGPSLGAASGVLRLAFTPDDRSIVAVTARATSQTWPLPDRGRLSRNPDRRDGRGDTRTEVTLATGADFNEATGALRLLKAGEWRALVSVAGGRSPIVDRVEGDHPHWERALVAERDGNFLAALWHLDRIRADPDDSTLLLRRVCALAADDRWEEVHRQIARLGSTVPRELVRAALLGFACDAQSASRTRQAVRIIDEILALDSNDATALMLRSEFLGQLGETNASMRDAVAASAAGIDLAWIDALADRIARLGRWVEVAAILRAADQRGDGLPAELAFHRAIASMAANDPIGYRDTCIRMIRRARAATAETFDELASTAAYACCLGPDPGVDLAEPIEMIRQVIAREPGHAHLNTLGGLLVRSHQPEEAMSVLARGIAVDHGTEYFSDRVFRSLAMIQSSSLGANSDPKSVSQEKSQSLWEDAEQLVLLQQFKRNLEATSPGDH